MQHLQHFVVGLVFASAVWFAGSPVVGEQKDEDESIDPEALVEALVNPGKPFHIAPQEYDLKAQEKIKVAWWTLGNNAEQACSTLVKHLDDKRYSISYHIAGNDEYPPKTVGHVCGRILGNAIEPAYRSHIQGVGGGGPSTYYHFSYARMKFKDKEWQKKFKKKPLFKMQIDAVKWAIQTVDDFETDDVDKKADALKKLRAQLKELKKSRVPVKTRWTGFDAENFPDEYSVKKKR